MQYPARYPKRKPKKTKYNNLRPNTTKETKGVYPMYSNDLEQMPELSARDELHELVDALDDEDIPDAMRMLLGLMGK